MNRKRGRAKRDQCQGRTVAQSQTDRALGVHARVLTRWRPQEALSKREQETAKTNQATCAKELEACKQRRHSAKNKVLPRACTAALCRMCPWLTHVFCTRVCLLARPCARAPCPVERLAIHAWCGRFSRWSASRTARCSALRSPKLLVDTACAHDTRSLCLVQYVCAESCTCALVEAQPTIVVYVSTYQERTPRGERGRAETEIQTETTSSTESSQHAQHTPSPPPQGDRQMHNTCRAKSVVALAFGRLVDSVSQIRSIRWPPAGACVRAQRPLSYTLGLLAQCNKCTCAQHMRFHEARSHTRLRTFMLVDERSYTSGMSALVCVSCLLGMAAVTCPTCGPCCAEGHEVSLPASVPFACTHCVLVCVCAVHAETARRASAEAQRLLSTNEARRSQQRREARGQARARACSSMRSRVF